LKGYNNNNNDNNQIIIPKAIATNISSQKAYYNFIDAIKSSETQKKYSHLLLKYIRDHLNLDKENLGDLLLQDPKKIEEDIISYIKVLRDKEKLSYSTINTRLAALYLFFTMNDIVLNRKKINRYLGEHIKTIKDRAYTREEIKKIVDACDLKFKVVVTLMVSSGCRIGAIPSLKLSALKYMEKYDLYQVTFYENTKSEYYSFTTPEFSKYLREYLDFRERCGERLTPNSPLIRNDFVMDDQLRVKNPKPLVLGTLSVCLRQILLKIGLRISTSYKRERHEVSANHAFRKYTHTTMANAKINVEIREMLLSHSIGLSGAYYRPTESEMLQEYLKVVNDLTVDPSHRLQKQVQELQQQDNYQKYIIDKKIKEMEEQNKILNQKLIKYEEHVKYTKEWEQKIDAIIDLKIEEKHINKEYESIPVEDEKRKDSVFKNVLETRKKRIKHENDYENLLREGTNNDYYY
jgi:integrase